MAWLLSIVMVPVWLCAAVSHAQVTPYEWVYQAGRNNLVDSNAQSCDAAEGCYTNSGARCANEPGRICALRAVP